MAESQSSFGKGKLVTRIAAGVSAVGTALAGAVAAPADSATENMDLHGVVNDIPALYAEVPATYITPDQRMRELIRELGGAAQDLANAGAGVLKRREETKNIEELGNALRKPDIEEYRG